MYGESYVCSMTEQWHSLLFSNIVQAFRAFLLGKISDVSPEFEEIFRTFKFDVFQVDIYGLFI